MPKERGPKEGRTKFSLEKRYRERGAAGAGGGRIETEDCPVPSPLLRKNYISSGKKEGIIEFTTASE